MSLRLLRWLAETQLELGSLEEAALAYARYGGFVDRARYALYIGDHATDAFGSLHTTDKPCHHAARRGEPALWRIVGQWTEAGSCSEEIIKVEDVLERVVAEEEKSLPVLLIVMDGMSYAIFHELLEEITDRGWVEIAPERKAWPMPVIAALPSITDVSRASLLCARFFSKEPA